MKILLVIITCLAGHLAYSQIALSLIDYNVVYRNCDNRLELGAGAETAFLVLESDQAQVFRTDSCFILRVSGTGKTVKVSARNFKDSSVVKTWEFRVMNLPAPVVYFGTYAEGETVTLDQPMIHVNYGENAVFANSDLEIVSYQVNSVSLEKPLGVTAGGTLTPEVMDALKKAKAVNKGKTITFDLVVLAKGKDGIIRKKTATFSY